jgi:hypothetical protein
MVPAHRVTRSGPAAPHPAGDRRAVASFTDYTDAQLAVDHLSDQRFPVERVMIVGVGLDFVEQVTGRRGFLAAGAQSAGSGAVIGALVGWVIGLFDGEQPLITALTLAVWGAGIGLGVGALIGLFLYAATGGLRDFSSVRALRASRYDVLTDVEVAEEATHLLETAGIPVVGSSGGTAVREDPS